jgi:hypothetical protein
MISFFTKDECDDIISISNNLKFEKNYEFGKFSYSFICETWVVDRIVDTFQTIKKIKILQPPIVRILKFDVGDYIPIHNFNYTDGKYKNTTYGSYIFLNSDISGGEFYLKGDIIKKEIGNGTLQPIDLKSKITKVEKNIMYVIVVNFLKLGNYKII